MVGGVVFSRNFPTPRDFLLFESLRRALNYIQQHKHDRKLPPIGLMGKQVRLGEILLGLFALLAKR